MARTRRARPDLSESWDDVEAEEDNHIYSEEDERQEMRGSYRPDAREERWRRDMRTSRVGIASKDKPRRSSRLSEGPELRIPSSPDAGSTTSSQRLRTSTPHFRLKERSMTSDAGKLNGKGQAKMRASTPHFRLNQRSMTSDAGKFGSRLKDEDDSEDEEDGSARGQAPVWKRGLMSVVAYAADVVGLALCNMKPIFGYLLLAYVLGGAVIFSLGFLTNSVNNALTPICRIPGVSWLQLPFCPTEPVAEIKGAAEFDQLVQVQSQFDDVLASAEVGATLPMDMKRSEAGIRDLKHVVHYSNLPSKNELVFEFGGFIDTAKQASNDLSRFSSRIGRALDQILSTNRWTLSVIDGFSAAESGQGSISRWFSENMNIFAPFQPVSLSRDILMDQYLRHTSAVEEQILALISEAHALLNILDNLDGRLDVIASIATRDGITVEGDKEELFAYLWTKLGGNKSSVAKLEKQLELLKEVGRYRRQAWAHVTTTVVKLQAIRDNLEDLRERVALPETIGDKVPLEVHIENINRGIERLEQQRDANRRLEADNFARVIARAERGEKRSIGDREL